MNSNWISVKDRLPEHDDSVLVITKKGHAVCIFLDSKKVNEKLQSTGLINDEIDINQDPYYFCCRSSLMHTLNGVTHWMPLPEQPLE